MLTVVCLLRSGPVYAPRHVTRLRDVIAQHLRQPHRFVCVSNMDVPCERIALKHDWPGYWSKIELFRPGLFEGQVVYVDLDTVIVGALDELFGAPHRFTMLQDFYWPEHPASGLMAWHAGDVDLSPIYHSFVSYARAAMTARPLRGGWGDQGVIAKHAPVAPDFWQERFPGRVVSYKVHVRIPRHPRERGNGFVPEDAAIVCYHGRPRPWDAGASCVPAPKAAPEPNEQAAMAAS
jgi:hypothetical protein